MSKFAEDTQKMLDLLTKVAVETIDRKRRLGHYYVIWQDGKPVAIGEDAPPPSTKATSQEQTTGQQNINQNS